MDDACDHVDTEKVFHRATGYLGDHADAWLCAECGAEVVPATYESRSARILRDNLSGREVWSPEQGWHD